jgi:hypothetical protein
MKPKVIVESTTNGIRLRLEDANRSHAVMFGPREISILMDHLKEAMAHCGKWEVETEMVPVTGESWMQSKDWVPKEIAQAGGPQPDQFNSWDEWVEARKKWVFERMSEKMNAP